MDYFDIARIFWI